MIKYIKFVSESSGVSLIVGINKDIPFDVISTIEKSLEEKINEYTENGEYWDSDETLICEVMDEYSVVFNFDYEIIEICHTINYY